MAHVHEALVEWRGGDQAAFAARRYGRGHRWRFDGGAEVPASSSPLVVPTPWSDPAGIDPEEALVAALASCHMLFFLDLASRAGLVVDRYVDRAVGTVGRRDDGREGMTGVTLRPEIDFAQAADPGDVAALHHGAHARCYIANSVNFPVEVQMPKVPA